MKYQLNKDKKKRVLTKENELKRLFLKYRIRSVTSDLAWRYNFQLSKLPRNSSKVRIQNRCILTNRSHSVHGHFRLSRIALRELGSSGWINGLKKSSW